MALLVYAPVAAIMLALGYARLTLLGGAVVVGGAMIPDLDQRVPGIAHRGPTHTVWFALAVGIGAGTIGGLLGWQRGPLAALGTGLFGVFVGTLTVGAHLLADVLTPTGIRPFAPVRDDRYTFDIAKAANPIANYALLAAGVVASGAALVVGAWI
nr:metal-dependent hydrolase [Halorientalis regularis]